MRLRRQRQFHRHKKGDQALLLNNVKVRFDLLLSELRLLVSVTWHEFLAENVKKRLGENHFFEVFFETLQRCHLNSQLIIVELLSESFILLQEGWVLQQAWLLLGELCRRQCKVGWALLLHCHRHVDLYLVVGQVRDESVKLL